MKKGLKKILAATTALALLLSLGTVAMAAEYTTFTSYDADGVHVTTTVNTAETDVEYTYLVHKSDDAAIADSEIVYIDQQKAVSDTVLFSFDTDVDNLGQSGNVYSATIQVGSNDADGAPTAETAEDSVINLENKTVTYSAVNGVVYVEAAGDATASTFDDTIIFKLIPSPGYTTSAMSITKGGVPQDSNTIISTGTVSTYSASVEDGDVFNFTFAEITGITPPNPTAAASAPSADKVAEGVTFTPNKFKADAAGTTRQLTYFGNVTGDAKEFGILVSKEAFSYDNGTNEFTADADVIKYAAAGKSNSGNFAISLFETKKGDAFESLLADGDLHVAVYAVTTDGLMIVSNDVAALNLE